MSQPIRNARKAIPHLRPVGAGQGRQNGGSQIQRVVLGPPTMPRTAASGGQTAPAPRPGPGPGPPSRLGWVATRRRSPRWRSPPPRVWPLRREPAPRRAPTLSCRQVTNCRSSLSETSCDHAATELGRLAGDGQVGDDLDPGGPAALAVRWRSPVAPAVPLPRLSLPLASMTNLCAASSFSTKVPVPEYTRAIGPSLTLHGAREVVALDLGDLRTREAARDGLDVLEGRPGVLDRGRHGERVGQLHAGITPPPRRAPHAGSARSPGAAGSRRRR